MRRCASDEMITGKIGKPATSRETGNHTGSWGSSEYRLAITPQQWSHSSHGYYAAHRYSPQEILYQVQPSIRQPKQSHPPSEHTLCLAGKREGKLAGIIEWKKEKKKQQHLSWAVFHCKGRPFMFSKKKSSWGRWYSCFLFSPPNN